MSSNWFYMPELPEVGAIAALDAREARHATGARRLNQGDGICLFDGRGTVADGVIAMLDGRDVQVHIEQRREVPPPKPLLHLTSALPKGDRQSVMLSMATQLGMLAFTPLLSARSVVKPGDAFLERSRRICIEACKQSRRPHVPVIEPASSLQEFLAAERSANDLILMAHPGGRPVTDFVESTLAAERCILLIGPEGGLTDEEVALAKERGAFICTLGDAILRIETAAIALLAVLSLQQSTR